MYILRVKMALSVRSDFAVAFTTIDRSVFAGLERYFGVFATFGAYCGEHLASVSVATVSRTLSFPGLAAGETALGLVSITPGRE